jgi:general secretion pathway protein K
MRPFAHRQRGAALLLAMLILTLVATLSGAMVWQQWRAIQVEAAERGRTQAAWILAGALDWARLILREDNRSRQGLDHLGEPWAVPLAEARLSSFLAADRDGPTDTGPDAFLSGSIVDAQARYNLANLVSGGRILASEVQVLRKLFESIGVSPDLATTIAVGLRDSAPPAANAASAPASGVLDLPPSARTPLQPRELSQLRWLGIDPATLQRMQDYVILLPAAPTSVNLNTAPREVLAAVIDQLDLAGAQRLVQRRERQPFEQLADAAALLGQGFNLGSRVGVGSDYFVVRGRLRLEDRVLEERSLVQRKGRDVTTLSRERLNSQDTPP